MPPANILFRRDWNGIKALYHFLKILLKERRWPDWQLMKVMDEPFYAERKLYLALRKAGYRVKTHVLFGDWEVDLYLPQFRLVIEVDGKHHESEKQKKIDRKKSYVLRKYYRLQVKRLKGKQVVSKTDWCVEKVHEWTGGPRKSLWKWIMRLFRKQR